MLYWLHTEMASGKSLLIFSKNLSFLKPPTPFNKLQLHIPCDFYRLQKFTKKIKVKIMRVWGCSGTWVPSRMVIAHFFTFLNFFRHFWQLLIIINNYQLLLVFNYHFWVFFQHFFENIQRLMFSHFHVIWQFWIFIDKKLLEPNTRNNWQETIDAIQHLL